MTSAIDDSTCPFVEMFPRSVVIVCFAGLVIELIGSKFIRGCYFAPYVGVSIRITEDHSI